MLIHRTLLASSLAVLVGGGMLFSAPPAQATVAIGDLWSLVAYPDSQSDDYAFDLSGFCALCHEGDSHDRGGLNPYGQALAPYITPGSKGQDVLDAFKAVEQLNSDGDLTGANNYAEIVVGTQPGWKSGDAVPPSLLLSAAPLDPDDPGGLEPDIAVAPSSVDYGAVIVGTSVTGTEVTVSNVGSAALEINGLEFEGEEVFSLGKSVPGTPFGIAPGASQAVGVVYTPDNEGTDNGSLLITSNDPDEPEVTVALEGTGFITDEPCLPSVDPASLDFGQVLLFTSLELPTTLTNFGNDQCELTVAVRNCTTGEFTLVSEAELTLGAGDSAIVKVAYAPSDEGQDACAMDITTDGSNIKVPMSGEGTETLPTDLDIKSFKASKNVSLAKGSGIVSLEITVENNGTEEGPGTLTITGQQGDNQFVHQVVQVSDPSGGGASKIPLQYYIAEEPGEIIWTAVLQDGDPDDDVATATTQVTR